MQFAKDGEALFREGPLPDLCQRIAEEYAAAQRSSFTGVALSFGGGPFTRLQSSSQ